MSRDAVKALLVTKFPTKHVDSCLKHFVAVQEKFAARDWDGVALKVGKFVEAVTKALMIHCGKTLPAPRNFKAGAELKALEQLDKTLHSDTVRIVIPKACIFAYEIVNNRGGRHDPGDIDANAMDATAIHPLVSWVLAELVRYCSTAGNADDAAALIEEVTRKVYPYFEDIDGRAYVNVSNLSAPDYALLLLYSVYPKRMTRRELTEAVVRHGATEAAAVMAISRMRALFDDDEGDLKLRGVGRQKAEELLKELGGEG